jgi:hypothetical protein
MIRNIVACPLDAEKSTDRFLATSMTRFPIQDASNGFDLRQPSGLDELSFVASNPYA